MNLIKRGEPRGDPAEHLLGALRGGVGREGSPQPPWIPLISLPKALRACPTALRVFSTALWKGIQWCTARGVEALYPPFCTLCAAATPSGSHLCAPCSAAIRSPQGARCQQCSRVFSGETTLPGRCADCTEAGWAFECAVAPLAASGPVREVIHQFKYEQKVYLAPTLSEWMVPGLEDSRLRSPPVDALVPVPLFSARQRQRGFNQARLLAIELGRIRALPVLDALKRVRDTGTQTRLGRTQRMSNLRGAFQCRSDVVQGAHLVLVDDVLTTGATLDACARVLLESGAASVRALAVARG